MTLKKRGNNPILKDKGGKDDGSDDAYDGADWQDGED